MMIWLSILSIDDECMVLELFCEALIKPYSQAKNFTDNNNITLDLYRDAKNITEYYSSLEEKNKDTLYLNLDRLYSVYQDKYLSKMVIFEKSQNKLKLLTEAKKFDEVLKGLERYDDFMITYNELIIDSGKMSLMMNCLNIIDRYNENIDNVKIVNYAADKNGFDKELVEYKDSVNKKIQKMLALGLSLYTCLITVLVILVIRFVIDIPLETSQSYFNSIFNWVIGLVAIAFVGLLKLLIRETKKEIINN